MKMTTLVVTIAIIMAFGKASVATEKMQNATEMIPVDINMDNVTTISEMSTTLHPCDVYLPDEETKISNDSTAQTQLGSCALICLEDFEYTIVNGTAFIETIDGNKTFNSSRYMLVGKTLRFCLSDLYPKYSEEQNRVEKFNDNLSHITVAGLTISIICLILHLVAFVLIEDLRNLPGCNLASLCLSLLIGYISFLVGHVDEVPKVHVFCILLACLTHFCLLSSFLWMNVIALDFMRAMLKARKKLQRGISRFRVKIFIFYCFYSLGIPAVFVVAAVTIDNVEGIESEYQPHFFGGEYCWFHQRKALLIFFVIPVFLLISMNVILFGWSAYTIFSNRMETNDVHHGMLKRSFVMYARLAVIVGLTWVAAFLAVSIDKEFIWYIFVVLNTLQGLFIFIAFTCTKSVLHFIRQKYISRRRRSSQLTSSTFQTYVNDVALFENEVEVTPESKDNPQNTKF